jgi:hypothetical protein
MDTTRNSQAKPPPPTTAELKEKLETANLACQLIEKSQFLPKQLRESLLGGWGWDGFGGSDLWDRVRPRTNDDGTGGWLPLSVPSDRRHGANWPLWRNIIELDMLRQESRVRVQSNSYARGLLRNLVNNAINKGYTYNVGLKQKPKPGEHMTPEGEGLCQKVQAVLDRFLALNNWNGTINPRGIATLAGTREREIYCRVHQDGECFLRFHNLPDGTVRVRFIEPEQVRDSQGRFDLGWTYGIQHQMDPFEDVETPLAYSIFWPDPAAPGGEASRMDRGDRYEILPAAEVLHLKGPDTPANVKRGTSDFLYDAGAAFDRAARLQRNASLGAAYRAATGEIWQHMQGTQSQVQSLADSMAAYRRTNPTTGSAENVDLLSAPAVRRVPMGQELVAQPADNTASYLEGVQGDIQQASAATCSPSFWLGDTQNANYSNLESASAPPIRAAQCEQEYYKAAFARCAWKALEWAAECGLLPADVIETLEITVEAPAVLHRNELEDAQTKQVENQAGVLSKQQWCAEKGRDYEQTAAEIQEDQDRFGPPGGELPMPGDDQGGPGGEAQTKDQEAGQAWKKLQKHIMGKMADPGGKGGGEGKRPFQESKDSSGHEHDTQGRFGTGGGSSAKLTTDHVTASIKKLGTKTSGFVDLHNLRQHLGGSREEQDKALMQAYRDRKITFSPHEGRHGISDAQRGAVLSVGGEDMGFAMMRESKDAEGHEHKGSGEGGGQFTDGSGESTGKKKVSDRIGDSPRKAIQALDHPNITWHDVSEEELSARVAVLAKAPPKALQRKYAEYEESLNIHQHALGREKEWLATHPGNNTSTRVIAKAELEIKDNEARMSALEAALKRGHGLAMDENGKWVQESKDDSGHEHAADGKFGTGGGKAEPEDKGGDLPKTEANALAAAPEKAKGILARFASLPKRVAHYAAGKASALYRKMEAKYGPRWAKAIVAVGIITLPTPVTTGAVAATVGLAMLSQKIFGKAKPALVGATESEENIDMERAHELAKELWEELAGELEDADDAAE